MAAVAFAASDNVFVDSPTPSFPPLPWMTNISAVSSASFIDTYLAFRTPPRLRPDPFNPYTCLDVLVAESIKDSPPLSALQLLDVVVLFPPRVVRPLIHGRQEEFVAPLQDLRSAVDSGDEPVVDAIDVLLALAMAGAGSAILAALSSTHDIAGALKCMHTWRLSAPAAGDSDCIVEALENIELVLRGSKDDGIGIKWDDPRAGSEAAVREMMPDASIEAIRDALVAAGNNAEAAVGILLDKAEGSAGLLSIGKRTERRKHVMKVDKAETFTGEKADGDGGYAWLKTRMDAEIARQATLDPDDPREEKRVGAYTFLLDGSAEDVPNEEPISSSGPMDMYNDDPDDAVLEGEEPLGSKSGARPAFLRAGFETGSSTEDDSEDDGATEVLTGRQRVGASQSVGSGRDVLRDNASRGGGARGRGRGASGVGRGGAGLVDGGRGRGGRGGSGRGGGRGRGTRGRGGRGAHGRRDGAAKKQARAGM